MRDILCEEYDVPLWVEGAPDGATRTFCVVRFKCTGLPESRDATELLASTETPSTIETKEGAVNIDVDKKSAGFPLARLCYDPEALGGMEIRLSLLRGTTGIKRTTL